MIEYIVLDVEPVDMGGQSNGKWLWPTCRWRACRTSASTTSSCTPRRTWATTSTPGTPRSATTSRPCRSWTRSWRSTHGFHRAGRAAGEEEYQEKQRKAAAARRRGQWKLQSMDIVEEEHAGGSEKRAARRSAAAVDEELFCRSWRRTRMSRAQVQIDGTPNAMGRRRDTPLRRRRRRRRRARGSCGTAPPCWTQALVGARRRRHPHTSSTTTGARGQRGLRGPRDDGLSVNLWLSSATRASRRARPRDRVLSLVVFSLFGFAPASFRRLSLDARGRLLGPFARALDDIFDSSTACARYFARCRSRRLPPEPPFVAPSMPPAPLPSAAIFSSVSTAAARLLLHLVAASSSRAPRRSRSLCSRRRRRRTRTPLSRHGAARRSSRSSSESPPCTTIWCPAASCWWMCCRMSRFCVNELLEISGSSANGENLRDLAFLLPAARQRRRAARARAPLRPRCIFVARASQPLSSPAHDVGSLRPRVVQNQSSDGPLCPPSAAPFGRHAVDEPMGIRACVSGKFGRLTARAGSRGRARRRPGRVRVRGGGARLPNGARERLRSTGKDHELAVVLDGILGVLKYAHENVYPWDENTCANAAEHVHPTC